VTNGNDNLKISTVAAVVTAVVLAVGAVVFVLQLNSARCADIAEVDSRVRQQELSIRYMQGTLDEIRADVKVIKQRGVQP
jgi:hypothetical protein